jgi:ADP-dependent NAD(P)H-hydrate dehydratase / NAD(P)H-hydrate epimerase
MNAVTAAQMRALEAKAIHECGIPAFVLMDHAGKAVAEATRYLLKGRRGKVIAVCGGGNNGGDGIVAARWLKGWRIPAEVHWLADPRQFKGSAALHCSIARKFGVPFTAFNSRRPAGAAIFVDALLGTGFSGPVRGLYKEAIDFLNYTEQPVVSVDIPSGLDADSGRPSDVAVRADVTVTMAFPKRGLLTTEGRPYRGRLVVADIGIPD